MDPGAGRTQGRGWRGGAEPGSAGAEARGGAESGVDQAEAKVGPAPVMAGNPDIAQERRDTGWSYVRAKDPEQKRRRARGSSGTVTFWRVPGRGAAPWKRVGRSRREAWPMVEGRASGPRFTPQRFRDCVGGSPGDVGAS